MKAETCMHAPAFSCLTDIHFAPGAVPPRAGLLAGLGGGAPPRPR